MEKTEIDKLDEKIKQLQEKKKQIQARDTAKQRKADTRKKILIGSTIMSAIKNNKMQWSTIKTLLDENLTRDNDRVLFDLPKKSPEQQKRDNNHD